MTRSALGLAGLLLLGSTACVTQQFDATTLGVPATLAAPAGEPVQGTPFRTSSHTWHGVFGLIPISQANLKKGLSRQLAGGTAVANLKITTRSRWSDVLITGLSLGLLVPRTVVYEGIIVGR